MSSATEELLAEGRHEGEAIGFAKGEAVGTRKTLLENVRHLMINFRLTAEAAMNALGISPEMQKELAPIINEKIFGGKNMKIIHTDKAPAAVGPYSQAIKVNGLLYTSGQIAIDPVVGKIVATNIEGQAAQCCKNLGAILEAAGYDFSEVFKTTCYLADIADFKAFNSVYEKYFISKPARSCVAVKELPMGALCEIELIAAK